MNAQDLKQVLLSSACFEEVKVNIEGQHYQIVAVSSEFEGMKAVQQQQFVYKPLMAYIASGELHAVTIKTFTPNQWQREKIFYS